MTYRVLGGDTWAQNTADQIRSAREGRSASPLPFSMPGAGMAKLPLMTPSIAPSSTTQQKSQSMPTTSVRAAPTTSVMTQKSMGAMAPRTGVEAQRAAVFGSISSTALVPASLVRSLTQHPAEVSIRLARIALTARNAATRARDAAVAKKALADIKKDRDEAAAMGAAGKLNIALNDIARMVTGQMVSEAGASAGKAPLLSFGPFTVSASKMATPSKVPLLSFGPFATSPSSPEEKITEGPKEPYVPAPDLYTPPPSLPVTFDMSTDTMPAMPSDDLPAASPETRSEATEFEAPLAPASAPIDPWYKKVPIWAWVGGGVVVVGGVAYVVSRKKKITPNRRRRSRR